VVKSSVMIRTFSLLALILLASFCAIAQVRTNAPAGPKAAAAQLNNLGTAYMNQQLFEKAAKAFQEAGKAGPELRIARINHAIALLNLGHLEDASAELEAALKLDPNDPHIWYNVGLLEKNSGHPEKAGAAFLRVTEIDANDADTWYFLGTSYAEARKFDLTIAAFQHALKINPLHASAQFGLARAYQQSGNSASAKEHLQRFQEVTQKKLGTPISLAYGEQGKYSLTEESPGAQVKVPPQIEVRFVQATRESGLLTKASEDLSPESLGPGACFLDYDNDGRPDIFLASNGKEGGMSLYHNLGNGRFEDVTKKAGLDPSLHAIGCTAGDYDNDGFADLAIGLHGRLLLEHNEKNGTFKDVTGASSIQTSGPILGMTFVDYDHDGDIDLYVSRSSGNLDSATHTMWRNNGNGTFTDVTDTVGLTAPGSSGGMIGSDYNNDRAVDIVVAGGTSPTIFQNPREGLFAPEKPWLVSIPSGTGAIAVADFDHDGWMDIAFTHSGEPGLTLWRNNQGKGFEQIALPDTGWKRGWGVAAFDYDNDGWVDLVAVGENKDGKGEIKLFRNLGPNGFKDVSTDVGLDKIALKDPRSIICGDYNGDGATDLLITQSHGPAILLKNEGGDKNNWLRLSLKGLNDNKSAIGTKVEIFSGANHQKFEIAGSSGYLGQNSTDIVVGLGKEKQADIVRLLWPTGVLQDEIEIGANEAKSITEIDRRGSSCPTLFAWNGKSYELVGDMLGAGVVGHWVAPGERNISRPVEYIKLSRSLQEKDGKLSLRFMEPLEESVYLDRVHLLAIDHPANLNVFPNEYFASNPPYPPFKIVFSENAKPMAGAWDEHGHDVLPDLTAHRYFGDFKLLPFMGYAETHRLELDLGDKYAGGPLWLLMHGEIEYYSATSMYAASQAGLESVSPFVEALGPDGKWTRVIDDLGFPAGGARTMTADLTGKLPLGTRRIRITTNLQIYWDNILIDLTNQEQSAQITSVPLASANLDFHGFPLKIENQPPGNVEYIYEKASATGPYTRPAGNYTRYGDVLPLLTDIDDRLAVFASGDEVQLEFDPTSLPPLPDGWSRDYFFAADGYEKDMDFYAYEGFAVDPLPFQEMTSYPYSGTFPSDQEHIDYLLQFNTRYVSGHEAQGYAFDYPNEK
jgi:tetratricopeptide (TPR) repeat protein